MRKDGRKLTDRRRHKSLNYTSEISDALETVYGRYKAQIKSLAEFIAGNKDDKVSKKQKQIADIFGRKDVALET
jgi:hypothetical protein